MKIKWFSLVRLTGLFLVLLYHFFQTKFPGGFIGVDVFFTFSGYLVTALFIDEYARTEQIDIIGFAKRRLYRIMPALVLMILLVMPLTLLVKKDFVAGIGAQVAAALGFTTNIYELITGGNYESQFIPHLFLHTWSLAIEVQFYVFWGLVVFVLSRLGLKPGQFRGRLFLLSAVLFGLTFVSLFVRAFLTDEFSSLYFSSTARSFSFFLGSIFATKAGVATTTKRFAKTVRLWKISRTLLYSLGCLVMLVFLAFLLEFNHMVTYLFGFSLASLFTALLIYTTRVLHEQTPNLSEPAWLTGLADLSYGIYLFHWPLYVIFSQLMGQAAAISVTVVLSVAFGALSFRVIEPLLAGKPVRFSGKNLAVPRDWRPVYAILGLSLIHI